jgi:hypothetical protein
MQEIPHAVRQDTTAVFGGEDQMCV